MRIVTNGEAWRLIRDDFESMDKECLVDIAMESMEGVEKGYLTNLGLADELRAIYNEDFMVFDEHEVEAIRAAKILYGAKE